jgi:hypothetical protein
LYDWADPEENSGVGDVVVTNGKAIRRVPYSGRTMQKNQDDKVIFHIDEYEIRLKEGLYRLIIKDTKGYRLPNFQVIAGETVNFNIPQYRFAWDEICNGDVKMLKSFHYDESHRDQLRKYSKPPYKKIQTDVFVLEKPFDMVVRYCGRERKGEALDYKFAQIYYKNYYVEADIVILNKAEMQIEAIVREASPTNEFRAPIIHIDGNNISPGTAKLIFDLQTGKLLDQ